MTIKYYIDFSDKVIILGKRKRDKYNVNADVLFTTYPASKLDMLADGSFNTPTAMWDISFKEPEGITIKKRILLLAMRI